MIHVRASETVISFAALSTHAVAGAQLKATDAFTNDKTN